MNTDERLKNLEEKVGYLISQTEQKNRNKTSLGKIILIGVFVVAAIFIFLFILALITFYTVD
ncbi:hypothetical protein [Priestia aryabhattai]